MDLSGTSGLSPYFHSGMLSICRAINLLHVAFENANEQQARQSIGVWLNELIWREFYHSILYNFPNVRSETFNPKFRSIEWRNSSADLHAWQKGETGFPIVDAGMRQLLKMGWMHNRARMIVASFLSKDLLINWQEGEAWFLKHLIDADIAANNGGWQWIAGVGTDAAPYFRIFNPTLQSMKFDPQGDYIRKWVPELRNVPATFIHEPIKMRSSEQKQYKCQIGIDYPEPIVDRKVSRLRTLEAYKRAKEI
jgi:deoxyribodipyrimidine photo-lyase